jgi:cyclopropane fatty-acyl-phospholipid synthase-like methyltransferase
MVNNDSPQSATQDENISKKKVRRPLKVRILRAFKSGWFSPLFYKSKIMWWDKKWSDTSHPEDIENAIPDELITANDKGWITPNSTALDIGCGGGGLSAWLAARGHTVLGVDYSAVAIEKASEWYGTSSNNLSFAEVDITKEAPPGREFNLLVDKGCFHGIPQRYRQAYVDNVVRCCTVDARFIMFMRLDDESSVIEELIRGYFSPHFDIVSVSNTDLKRVAGSLRQKCVPALVVKMIKK